MKKFILIFISIMMVCLVSAHQPRIDFKGTLENPIKIEDPEISKAYYGELNGSSEYYEINSDTEFLLYVNILSPDSKDARTDFSVEIVRDRELLSIINGSTWKSFYEPFGGDNYLMGPEFERQVSPGRYLLKVSNPDNTGKYSLAVGKIESFPPSEIVNTFIALPKIKRDFFNKSPLTSYFNYSGLFLLILLAILAAIIIIASKIIKRYRRKKK